MGCDRENLKNCNNITYVTDLMPQYLVLINVTIKQIPNATYDSPYNKLE